MLPPSQRKMRKTSFRTRCSASLDVDEELWRAVVTPNALAVIRAERDQWIDTRRPSSWNPARRCCRQRQQQRGSRNGRGLVGRDPDELIAGDFEFQQSVWLEASRRFARYVKRRRQSVHQGPKRLLG